MGMVQCSWFDPVGLVWSSTGCSVADPSGIIPDGGGVVGFKEEEGGVGG